MEDETKKELQAPFQPQDIEWRVQKSGLKDGKPWAMVVPFITSRAIEKRLDDVFGLFGWENEYKAAPPSINKDGKAINNWLCGITIKKDGESVTKWNGSPETNIEQFKGGLSGGMKRTGSTLGIGRYLYQLDVVFAMCVVVNSRRDCNEDYPNFDSIHDKKANTWTSFAWANPPLPEWALPNSDFNEFLEPIKNAESMLDLRTSYEVAYKQAEASGNSDNTETLIEAKDKRKSELEKILIEEKAANLETVTVWLQKQIDAQLVVPNESAVTAYYETTNEVLNTKLESFKLDPKPLQESFKGHYKARIEALKPKQEKKS